jgi:hypothetical protein
VSELGRNEIIFPSGASVVTIISGTPGATDGAPPTGVSVATVVTSGPGGVLPPGYDADPAKTAWPGATVVIAP